MRTEFRSKQTKLANILDIQTGFQIRDKSQFGFQGNYNIIQVKDTAQKILHYIEPIHLDKISIPENKKKFMHKYILKKQDVLYLSKLHFKAFRYIGDIDNIIPMSHFYILRPKKRLDGDYLCWILNEIPFKAHIQGSTLPFISKVDLMSITIPLPSIEIQKKIAQILQLRAKELKVQAEINKKKEPLINAVLHKLL